MGVHYGGGENFDFHMSKACLSKKNSVSFISGKKIFSCPISVSKNIPNISFITTPYLRRVACKIKSKRYFMRKLSAFLYHVDNFFFEWVAYRKVTSTIQKSSDTVLHLCSLPRLASWLSKKGYQCIVRWPGPPSRSVRKYMHDYWVNYAHGDTMKELLKIDPSAINIPAGYDPDIFYFQNKSNKTVRFVFTGRLIPMKRLQGVVDAFGKMKALLGSRYNVELHIIGDGPDVVVTKSKLVFFHGALYGEELGAMMRSMDVFCINSTYESFSMVTLEAMACGMPVIYPDVGFLPKLVGQAGIGCGSGDEQAYLKAMKKMAIDTVYRENLSQLALARAQQYSWESSASLLHDELKKVIAE